MDLIFSLIAIVVQAAALLIFRIAAASLLALVSSSLYFYFPNRRQLIHLFQGALISVVAIYLVYFITKIFSQGIQVANVAFIMAFLNLTAVFGSNDRTSKENGTFSDSLGGSISSILIWISGITF